MIYLTCITDNCPNPVENQDTGECASCGAARRKQDRVKVKEVRSVKKVSDKRASENQVYAKLRKEYMDIHTVCECCKKVPSTECHHMRGRGEHFLNPDYYLAVCEPCHKRITEDSAWAIANGYSYLRTQTI